MKVELVKPQGYCAGVLNAINIALKAKKDNPQNRVFVLGMLVHNQYVINQLNSKGIITLENLNDNEIPTAINQNDIIIFTAHGHSDTLEEKARNKGVKIYDATCPIVKKNLDTIKNEILNNHQVIYIGQSNHKETLASLSISNNVILFDTKSGINFNLVKDKSPFVINQTTLNFLSLKNIHDEILLKIPEARIENEICSATRSRQEAILSIDSTTDLIIIVGDKTSSNSNKLYDIAKENYQNCKVIMVENLDELKSYDLRSNKKATIASGASTPIDLVKEIKNYLLNY